MPEYQHIGNFFILTSENGICNSLFLSKSIECFTANFKDIFQIYCFLASFGNRIFSNLYMNEWNCCLTMFHCMTERLFLLCRYVFCFSEFKDPECKVKLLQDIWLLNSIQACCAWKLPYYAIIIGGQINGYNSYKRDDKIKEFQAWSIILDQKKNNTGILKKPATLWSGRRKCPL